MQYTVETAEGQESITESGMTIDQFEALLEAVVEQKLVSFIPNLVNQVRVSEELWVQARRTQDLSMATICARAARALLDIKYGPLQNVMLTPPVDKRGRWQW